MAGIIAPIMMFGQDTFTPGLTQNHPLGTAGMTKDGRIFRYCQAGGVDLVAGNLIQGAAPLANHLANTPPVVAVGDKSFSYTPGATAGAANLYAEGYLQVDTTPGNGLTYQVAGHAAITASVAFTLLLVDAIQVALTASSRVGLIPNAWKNVIQSPTTPTAKMVGFAPVIIPTTAFGWLCTHGVVSALIDATAPLITAPVVPSTATAGAVAKYTTAAADVIVEVVGKTMQVTVSAKNNFIFALID